MNILYVPRNVVVKAENLDVLTSMVEHPQVEKYTHGGELMNFEVKLHVSPDVDLDYDDVDSALDETVKNIHTWAARRRVTGARGDRVAIVSDVQEQNNVYTLKVQLSNVVHYNETRFRNHVNDNASERALDVDQLRPYIDEVFLLEVNYISSDGEIESVFKDDLLEAECNDCQSCCGCQNSETSLMELTIQARCIAAGLDSSSDQSMLLEVIELLRMKLDEIEDRVI